MFLRGSTNEDTKRRLAARSRSHVARVRRMRRRRSDRRRTTAATDPAGSTAPAAPTHQRAATAILERRDPVRAAVRGQGRDILFSPVRRQRERPPDRRLRRRLRPAGRLHRRRRSSGKAPTSSRPRSTCELEGGNPPDVIDFPQPGLLAQTARKGYLIPFPDDVAAHTTNDFIAGWDVYATVDGKIYGMPGRSNVKSMVWYSPAAFTDRRLRDPGDARGPHGAVRQDRRRRRHPVVRRRRVGRCHRLGAHRLDRRLHAAHQRRRGVRPVGQPRDPVQRPEGEGRR